MAYEEILTIKTGVVGPSTATGDHIAAFDDNTGKVIKDSGFTIGKSVPSNAVFTDTITTNIIVSATQPTGQRIGDFWYKTV